MFLRPCIMVVAGVIGMVLFGWQTYSDVVTPPPRPLLDSEVSYFRGRPAKMQMSTMGNGMVNFRVWLVDHPVAFQQTMFAGPGSLDRDTFEKIVSESEITIGVKISGLDTPGVDRRSKEKFLTFVSIESGGKQISSLADYNKRMAKPDESGSLVTVLLIASAITFGLGLLMLRGEDSDSDEHVDWETS